MSKSDIHRFDDLFGFFGPIVLRRFFGGEGIYSGDVMIGMVFDDRIFFKTDEHTRKAFIGERTQPFSFTKRSTGERVVTGWYALPERLYDEPEELAKWARDAFAVASASPTTMRKRARKTPPQKHRAKG